MHKPITQRLADTRTLEPGSYNPVVIKCPECKKRFERLSDRWAYKIRKDGKYLWLCSWRCYRDAEARLYPKQVLRGEYYAEHALENNMRYKATAKTRALGNKG